MFSLHVVSIAVVLACSGAFARPLLDLPAGYRDEFVLDFDPNVSFELQVGGVAYSPEGRPIVYESGEIKILGGDTEQVLATFDPAVFGSFLTLTPEEDAVYFGENLNGNIYSVALDGRGSTTIGNVPSNHDLAFAPAGAPEPIRNRAFLSALGANDNSIYLLDPETSRGDGDEIINNIPSFSGPLAFDDTGNLYYITVLAAPALVRFSPELLEAGIGDDVVDFTAGELLLSELDGAFDLVWNRGKLYLTNLGFATGTGSIEIIDTERNFLHTVWATVPFEQGVVSATFLAVHPGSEDFLPGTGKEGGKMLVYYTDFSSVGQLVEVAPQLFFVRGEVNGDGAVDLSDGVSLLEYLFTGGEPPRPLEAADVNLDGALDLSDVIFLFDFLFRDGDAISAPFPNRGPSPTQ